MFLYCTQVVEEVDMLNKWNSEYVNKNIIWMTLLFPQKILLQISDAQRIEGWQEASVLSSSIILKV